MTNNFLAFIPWVAAHATVIGYSGPGIPTVARFRPTWLQLVLWFVACIYTMQVEPRGYWRTALCGVGETASQFDRPSLMPLSVASCGRLQLGAQHYATSVDYWLQVVQWRLSGSVVENWSRNSYVAPDFSLAARVAVACSKDMACSEWRS